MSEGIIAAIIGVISSICVFIATMIANKISYKKQIKFEKRKAITDKLCGMIYDNNKELLKLKKCMSKCTYSYSEYIENKGVYFEYKENVENEYKLFKETHNKVVENCEEILFFIENNIIPLYEYQNYYHGIKEQLYDISELEQFYYEQNVDCSDEVDVNDLTQEDIDYVYEISEVTNGSINKVYMYSYNLLVNLQNDTYSNFFDNKRMIELWDYRYYNLEKVKSDSKEIDLFFGGCILS